MGSDTFPLDSWAVSDIPVPLLLTADAVVEYRIRIAIARIHDDVKSGFLPYLPPTFSELHDFTDANMYMIDEEHPISRAGSFYAWEELDIDQICELLNRVADGIELELSRLSLMASGH